MNNLSQRLNCKVDVYGMTLTENELGEKENSSGFIKKVWAEILPSGGSLKTLQDNTEYAEISHKFTIRAKAIPNLDINMYFIYNNQRFNINYFQDNFKYKNSIEIMCSLVVE